MKRAAGWLLGVWVGITVLNGLPAASSAALPESATEQEVVACVRNAQEAGAKAYPRYSFVATSHRIGYSESGEVVEDYSVVKRIEQGPGKRVETFVRGEKNGKPAELDDFWFERLGLASKFNVDALNLFSAQYAGQYEFGHPATVTLSGAPTWKLEFKAKKAGEQQMQRGHIWIDQKTCGVVRAVGTLPDIMVAEQVRVQVDLVQVRPGLWLPSRQQVDLEFVVPMMRRRSQMVDVFSSYTFSP